MSSSVAVSQLRRGVASLAEAGARERRIQRRVGLVWYLLVLNCLTYFGGGLLHLPSAVGKAITQGALYAALFAALTVNRKLILRPNVFLCLVSLLVLGVVLTTLQPEHIGTIYRAFRLAVFIAVLWLLTPWWGRRDLLLVRCHLKAMAVVLGTVLLGLMIAPGRARAGGRLNDIVWPSPPTQVAHYAAVTFGLVVVLWLCGQLRGRITVIVVTLAGAILILTHTRTALVGLGAGLLVAGLSLIVAKARVRKLFAAIGAVATIAILTLSSAITSWLARGQQGNGQLTDLTGRTVVWSQLVAFPRNKFQEIFGFGLSNDSFNGLPIDSNWLASYQTQGLYGVVLCVMMLLFLLVTAYFTPRGVERALALFLVTYCLIASFTEVGFTDASTYLLELTLAASLLVPSASGRRPI
jgi:O-Antigen ligase